MQPALQTTDTVYNLLEPLFCSSLSNPAIVLVKLTVFILRYSQSVYCLLNSYICLPLLNRPNPN